jgi:hypothetical protein
MSALRVANTQPLQAFGRACPPPFQSLFTSRPARSDLLSLPSRSLKHCFRPTAIHSSASLHCSCDLLWSRPTDSAHNRQHQIRIDRRAFNRITANQTNSALDLHPTAKLSLFLPSSSTVLVVFGRVVAFRLTHSLGPPFIVTLS